MDPDLERLKRLVKAQHAVGKLAHAKVAQLAQTLQTIEQKIAAIEALSNERRSPGIFDSHAIRHMHSLSRRAAALNAAIQDAQRDALQETRKSDRLHERLRIAQRQAHRKRDEQDMTERLSTTRRVR
ncbi:MAG: hypothetical protein AAGF28_00900 [Pseudomonadota bacterium]